MKARHFKENRAVRFIWRHAAAIAGIIAAVVILCYFANLMLFQNEETVLGVAVLEQVEDGDGLEQALGQIIGMEEDEKIMIQSLDTTIPANQPIVTTWIRAGTVDLVIGTEEEIELYASAGYLTDLSVAGEKLKASEERKYMCGTAEYDDEGNVTSIGEEQWFGVYADPIPGVDIEDPVIALSAKMSHEEAAWAVFSELSSAKR